STTTRLSLTDRLREYAVLLKLRLSFLVVVSAVLGYFFSHNNNLYDILLLVGGGFLVTGSSNACNQVWEREYDAIMKRTQKRPLVTGTLSVGEALTVCIVTGISGLVLLYFLNPLSMVLGFLAFFLYVFIYTPMKRISSWSVFVGAFPGAIPPMLGYVAATGEFGLVPGILFLVQFMWQFPHFWAIAWVQHDEYMKAGYRMLPSDSGRNSTSAFIILVYTVICVLVSFAPFVIGEAGYLTVGVCSLLGVIFIKNAMKLQSTLEIAQGKRLMFTSFYYLPLIQLIYVIEKWI
ncbi:MAG: heme o synthase, partial [Flavobacteriales bacterium]